MNIFNALTAGDSADWLEEPKRHHQTAAPLTSADWGLTYHLRGPSQLSLAGTAEGDGWRMRITSVQSALLLPGQYAAVAQLSRNDERLTLGRVALTIMPDLAAQSDAMDVRSVAERALADCEKALATFTNSGGKVQSYTIGGRSTTFYSLTELMSLRDMWKRAVKTERARANAKKGRRNPTAVLVRFQ